MSQQELHIEFLKRTASTSWERRISHLAAQLEHIDLLPEEEAAFYNLFVNPKLVVCCDDELNSDFFAKYTELRKFGLSYKEALYTLGFFPGKAKSIAEGRCIRSWKIYKKLVEVEVKTASEMKVDALRALHKGLTSGNLKAAMFYLEKYAMDKTCTSPADKKYEEANDLGAVRKARLEELRRCKM